MKIKVTQQQRDNALQALNVMWPSVPPENVTLGLGEWRHWSSREHKPHCNTIACFGGWCALWPPFQQQGVKVTYGGSPTFNLEHGGPAWQVADKLFGTADMFCVRKLNEIGTDHEVVAKRLHKLIANSRVV